MTPEQWAELLKRLDPSAVVDCSEKWVATDGEFDIRVLNRLLGRVIREAKAEAWDVGYMRGGYPCHFVDEEDPIPPAYSPPTWGRNANPYK